MSKKSKNKKEYEQLKGEQWIQMEDLRDPQNQTLSRKFALQQGKKYEQKPIVTNNIKNNFAQNDPNIANQLIQTGIKRENNKQNERKQDLTYKKNKKPSIPLMLVTCQYCTVSQNVPGNTQVYTCGSCQNMNQCEPLYGVFNCGNCQAKVCYGFGISVMIKCPKCKSINKVPSEPYKKYESRQEKQEKTNIEVEKQRERDTRYKPIIQNQKRQQQEEFKYPGID